MIPNEGGKFIHVYSVLSSDYCAELKSLVLLLLSLNLYWYHVILSPLIVQWAQDDKSFTGVSLTLRSSDA